MKKLIYSLLVAGLVLTGCTTFDSESSQKYGDGPSIAINVTATADSTFTFTLTPATGTQYYSYLVVKGTEAGTVSASSLLKGQLSGVSSNVIKAADNATYTYNMRSTKTKAPLCSPNTSYIIYAVAASDKGIVGTVSSQVVTTSDGIAPYSKTFIANTTDKSVAITFSEAVTQGSGKVTAKYYKEWDATSPFADIAESDIKVSVSSNIVTVATANVPNGAYVFISWAQGAFNDSKGNGCVALTSGLNSSGTAFTGINYRVDKKTFAIAATAFSNIGKVYTDWSSFNGTATFDFNIYRNENAVQTGDVSVVYKNSTKSTTIELTPSQWSINGKTLNFTLPEAPASGDVIYVVIKEDVIYDVYGNPNTAFSSEDAYWNFYSLEYGTYSFTYVKSGITYSGGSFTLAAGASTNAFVIKDFYLSGSEITGYFDPASGKLYIENYAHIGLKTSSSSGTTYGLITYSLADSNADYIEFSLGAGGVFNTESFAIVACDANYKAAIGYWLNPSSVTFTPVSTSSRAIKSRSSRSSKSYGVSKLLRSEVSNVLVKH
jgi:hypothetical protein